MRNSKTYSPAVTDKPQKRPGSKIVVALAGNPNSGKTTLFNALTGTRQHVGNYPGVTVERKEGICRHTGCELQVVDLPGIYSLTAYSMEEVVARNVIVEEGIDVVADIVDASNLERNLYLAIQLMEMRVPLVLAFNMSDMAKARGLQFDIERLSQTFGVRIVETVGHRGLGVKELLDAVLDTANSDGGPAPEASTICYGQPIEQEIAAIEPLLETNGLLGGKYPTRWLAVKLLEEDKLLRAEIESPELDRQLQESVSRIEKATGESPEIIVAGARYAFIADACQDAVRSTIEIPRTMSDRIDSIVTNRVLAIPVFLGLMYLVFQLTFTLGEAPMGWIENLFGWLGGVVKSWWPEGSESLLKSLLVDGIIGGAGGVLVFLPNILLLFLAIAVLEDSGYMARAAFIMDRFMHKIGLHGKSFIPMLIGFGCSVPAIMATRTLETRRDRLTTMLVTPLMSCGARLPIYAMIIPAFFPRAWHAPVLWIIYLIGILLAILCAKLLRSTLFKGESVPFVMELPPYRMPTIKSIVLHMWERGRLYLRKAGTIILGISIVLWAMMAFPALPEEQAARFDAARQIVEAGTATEEEKAEQVVKIDNEQTEATLRYTVAGQIGHLMSPILKPMGFDWRIGTALIGAFAAKEVFVAQLGIVFSVGEADEQSETLREILRKTYTPLVGFCIMLFCLISAPCMATIAVTRRESNSWGWAMFQVGGLTALAYVLTVLVFQTGYALGIGV
jgi:ferrous iron transport protein B